MPDALTLRGIRAWTRLGVPDSERATEQLVTIDVTWPHAAQDVATNDDVTRGIDYAQVHATILATAQTGERSTLERLAEDVAQAVLACHAVECIDMTIRKFPLPGVAAVELSLSRSRS